MDELNDLIAAMPDGGTLTLAEGETYDLSGPFRILGKRGITLRLAGATIRSPHGMDADFTGSRDCRIDGQGAAFACTEPGAGYGFAVQEPEGTAE